MELPRLVSVFLLWVSSALTLLSRVRLLYMVPAPSTLSMSGS